MTHDLAKAEEVPSSSTMNQNNSNFSYVTETILHKYPVTNTEWIVVGVSGSVGNGLTLFEYMMRYYPYILIHGMDDTNVANVLLGGIYRKHDDTPQISSPYWGGVVTTPVSFPSNNEKLYFVRTPERHHAKSEYNNKPGSELFLDPWNRAFIASPWSADDKRISGKAYSSKNCLSTRDNNTHHGYWHLINEYNKQILGSVFFTTVDGTIAICINIAMAATLK